MTGYGFLVYVLLRRNSRHRLSLAEQKHRPRSATFPPVAIALVYLRQLAALLRGEGQSLRFTGHGQASGKLERQVMWADIGECLAGGTGLGGGTTADWLPRQSRSDDQTAFQGTA
mgnify:CR=1 FL=1|jgi:hypothetical protein